MKHFDDIISELNAAQRRKKSLILKKTAKKRELSRKRNEKKKKSPEKLKQLARKQARNILKKKILKKRKWEDLSFAERDQIDKKLAQKGAVIAKIAKKILPKVKQAEQERLKRVRSGGDHE